jgi:hypothetical protein
MNCESRAPIGIALKILSAQYRDATGENITDAEIEEIRKWAGEGGEKMSPLDAACVVIRMELTRDRTARIQ